MGTCFERNGDPHFDDGATIATHPLVMPSRRAEFAEASRARNLHFTASGRDASPLNIPALRKGRERSGPRPPVGSELKIKFPALRLFCEHIAESLNYKPLILLTVRSVFISRQTVHQPHATNEQAPNDHFLLSWWIRTWVVSHSDLIILAGCPILSRTLRKGGIPLSSLAWDFQSPDHPITRSLNFKISHISP
jgi:hypothetical protein